MKAITEKREIILFNDIGALVTLVYAMWCATLLVVFF